MFPRHTLFSGYNTCPWDFLSVQDHAWGMKGQICPDMPHDQDHDSNSGNYLFRIFGCEYVTVSNQLSVTFLER